MIGVPLIVIALTAYIFVTGGRYVSTDNAYVQADRVAISPGVSGRVVAILVRNNQSVKKGDVLLELDPADYDAAERQAAADLANAMQALNYAVTEERRQRDLKAIGVASQADVDKAKRDADMARQQVAMARPRLDVARKNHGDTHVKAPADGIVTKVDQTQVGAVVNASQPMFFLLSGAPWIEANFKEDQLRDMRVGETAEVKIDAFNNVKLKARLKSFSPGTGSSFSLLPPENATGNWVKVTQRVPVQFELIDPPTDIPMIAGLSASVKVDTKTKPGAETAAAR